MSSRFISMPAIGWFAHARVVAGLFALMSCAFPAWAQPSIATSTSFDPAGTARDAPTPYMDWGGVWNSTTELEVTNTTGDTFTITLENSADGTPNPLVNDVAYDIDLTLSVPAGFRLPSSPFTVAVDVEGGDTGAGNCVAPAGAVTAAQSGNTINFDFPAGTNLPGQGAGSQPCRYILSLGLTTTNIPPFFASGTYNLNYSFRYNIVDNDSTTQQTVAFGQSVEVRRGDIIVTKTAIPNTRPGSNGAYANGETASWTVTVFNNGSGGTFDVLIDDTLGPNFNAATLQLTPPPPASPLPPGVDVYTLSYLPAGQEVDITVSATVAIGAAAGSCPDLRNNVSAQDRLGNSSSNFASVVFDLEDPVLSFTPPPDFEFDYGTPGVFSFSVSNAGAGAAHNVSLQVVAGLDGVTVSNVSPGWTYNSFTSTFTHVAAGGIPAGSSSPLQFTMEVNACDGPNSGFLVWRLQYENVCGLDFTAPDRNSTFSVINFPLLGVNKVVDPTASNFGAPDASYTINLTGNNIPGLASDGVDDDGDWVVEDTLPSGVGSGVINAIPPGTVVSINGGLPATAPVAVAGGDTIFWSGDRDDLTPLPSLIIDFTVTDACAVTPPATFPNTARLDYPGCAIITGSTARMVVNDSPINTEEQAFVLLNAGSAPFEPGRPDTDLTPNSEPNEGERITFSANYEFPDAPYSGTWSGSSFRARMGTGAIPERLQLAFRDTGGLASQPDAGEATSVTIVVRNPLGTAFTFAELPVGAGPGQVNIDANGFVIDLSFIAASVPDMAGAELDITYHVTAPEGVLDANLQPAADGNRDDNVDAGVFDELAILTISGDGTSCAGTDEFIQGVGVLLDRGDIFVFNNTLDPANDAGACGPTTATVNLFPPSVISGLKVDNFRILLNGSNYDLPDALVDFTFTGAGNPENLANPGLVKTFTPVGNNVEIQVTPDTQNLAGNASIQFPVTLRSGFTARTIPLTIFYDSNHTSPDYTGPGSNPAIEAYTATATLSAPPAVASLSAEFFPPQVVLGDPELEQVDPSTAALEGVFTWRVRITNFGTTTIPASNYVLTNEVPPGFLPYREGSLPQAEPSPSPDPFTDLLMVWDGDDLGPLAPGASVEVTVAIALAPAAGCNIGSNETSVLSGCTTGRPLYSETGPGIVFPEIDVELEHLDTSYCELCREGTVQLEVRNEGASNIYDLLIREELGGSDLEYVAGSGFVTFEGGAPIALEPIVSGTQLIWNSVNLGALIDSIRGAPGQPHLFSDLNGSPSELVLSFNLRSSDSNPANLLSDSSREITATAEFDLFCGTPNASQFPPAEIFTVPLRQPQPTVDKQGRNFSARQSDAQYSDPVFGGTDDVLVWRVDVQNSGVASSADLEDLLVNDTIGGNFNLRYICPNEAASMAMAAALETGLFGGNPAPAPVAPCIVYTPSLDVDDPFGNPANDEPGAFTDAQQGESAFIYYVGEIATLCQNQNNSANIEWGCEGGSPRINDSTTGVVNADGDDTALMSTAVDVGGVAVTQTVTGINPTLNPDLGTRGIVTVTINNGSGGTVRDLVLTATLPTDYEIDLTSLSAPGTLTVTPAFSTYPGITNNYTLDSSNPAVPVFTFISNTQGTPSQRDLLRNGDRLVLTFQIIRVRPFDNVNDPQIRIEDPATVPPSDPDYLAMGANQLSLQFDDTCDSNPALPGLPLTDSLNVNIDPEDIDINIIDRNAPADPNLFFILSDPVAQLALDVVVTNNGGHGATAYDAWVTIGDGIDIVGGLPAGCSGPLATLPDQIGFPPSNPSGILPPEYNPLETRTYRCVSRDPLPRGQADTFSFTVQRAMPLGLSGDLTFRADVLGRSTLSDGSAPPDRGAAGYPYYSKDNILARIIGFNLRKALNGDCSEDNPPPVANSQVLIGEECTLRIEAEWFGFATPGFGNIEIHNARIYEGSTSNNPPAVPGDAPDALDGQGFISLNTSGSVGVDTQNPAAPGPLDETGFMWLLETITATGNTEENFVADLRFRSLNDPVDIQAAPNVHGALRTDEVNARFDVVFTASGETFTFNEGSAGYPAVQDRQAGITILEPNVTFIKEVCNESESAPGATGANCAPFTADTLLAASDDILIYRLRVTNEDAAGGFPRAPAYDVAITDIFGSDLLAPFPFADDLLDNDGDLAADEVDEAAFVFDTTLNNAIPAEIDFTIPRINPGQTITLLYRARADASVAPGQDLVNTADGGYDSLPGDFGAQSAPQQPTGDIGGARQYEFDPAEQVTVEIGSTPAAPGSKTLPESSRTHDLGGGGPLEADTCTATDGGGNCTARDVVIGEEVRVRLEFTLPVSVLNQLVIEDNLPPGIECIEADDIVLPLSEGANPRFTSAGPFTPVCNGTQVRWNLGDQELQGTGDYMLTAEFIARVRNIPANFDTGVAGPSIRNGGGIAGGGTNVFLSYRDAADVPVTIPTGAASLKVLEPELELTKIMEPANPGLSVDAVDTLNVTIEIENSGTSPAYDIELLDTLDPPALNLSFVAGSSLSAVPANPPHSVDISVPGTLRFTLNDPLPAGASISFTYQVQVDTDVQPLEVLSNTVNARFSSLPDNTVALNSTGVIGPDGTSGGLRTGFLPPDAGTDPLNDYEAEASASQTVPALTLAKSDLDPTVVPTIGARKHFQLVISLPESVAEAVVVEDVLDTGATSFILENDAANDITYIFEGIASINNNAIPVGGFATPADAEAALAAFNAVDEATGTVTWNFGTVITETEDDATDNDVNPRIVIDYYARVGNNTPTVAGVVLQNAANLDYTDGETGAAAPTVNAAPVPPVTVLEPELRVEKLYDPSNVVILGATAEFSIAVTNVGDSTAWDATIVDMLPNQTDSGAAGGMCANAPVITAIGVGAPSRSLTAGTDYTATFVPPAPGDLYCSFTIVLTPTAVTSEAARIEAGEVLTITYETMVDSGTPAGSSLTNVAGATRWFSLDTNGAPVPPEIRQYDRALTLRPDPDPGTAADNNDHQDAVTVTVVPPDLDVIKSVRNLTTGQDPATTASPGDTLHYTIVIDNANPIPVDSIQIIDIPDQFNIAGYPDGFFENSPAGTLRNIEVNGVDFSASPDNFSDPNGGNGSGRLDLRNQTVPANSQLTIEFDIDVESPDQPLPHAFILNQASVIVAGSPDPIPSHTAGNLEFTQTEIINTATGFEFEKSSQDESGDPNVLAAGDILRYTIRIRNVGLDDPAIGLMNAVDAVFRDQVPAHTTYFPNSTSLNGVTVPHASPSVPPFVDGMLVNSRASSTPGLLLASRDPSDAEAVEAIVSFAVTINSGLVNGTVISNHALLTGQEQAITPFTPLPFPAVGSDDPATVSIPDDPTQDTVGSGVNVDALKTVRFTTDAEDGSVDGQDGDLNDNNVVDQNDRLLYVITVINSGNAPANNVVLYDPVPAGTVYVANSASINGNPVNDAVPGVSPLAGGMGISSNDLLPDTGTPMSPPATGQLSVSPDSLGNERAATITFQVTVTAGAGSVLSNQATVRMNEQPDEPSDADGNDENGDQPTVLTVGGAARLEIAKEVIIVGGGTARPNGQLEYRIRVENTGDVAATGIRVTDNLNGLPVTFVPNSGRLDGNAIANPVGNVLTADYESVYGLGSTLEPGDSFTVTFRVTINPDAMAIDNIAVVSWNSGNASDGANIDVGGAPGVVNVNGRVWDNRGLHDDLFDAGDESPLAGWRVRAYVNNDDPLAADTPLAETVTDAQGLYNFTGLAPVDAGDLDGAYTITFSVPNDPALFPAGSNVALGNADSTLGVEGPMIITNLSVPAGRNAQDQNLPVDPTGVVYNSITRQPVQGARVRLFVGNNPVSDTCFTTPDRLDSQQGQMTSALGFYRFDLNFGAGDCPPAGADFVIHVETPGGTGGFARNISEVIPPETGTLDVVQCPNDGNDRVPAPPPDTCEVQEQGTAPGSTLLPGSGTRYFNDIRLQAAPAVELFNNHLPVDTEVGAILAITKQTPLKNVTRGQLVPYTITVTNNQDFAVIGMEIRDFFPAGFKYMRGSAVIDGQPVEPVAEASASLVWGGLSLQPDESLTLKLLLVVGSGVGENEYTNHAQVFINGFDDPISGRASATVRVVPDPTFDCSDIIGKVYDDRNANGYPDEGEPGIAGARIATVQGLLSTTDKYGRFHITCAAVPNPDRGSNFILKLDERSLPSGYRVTTENPRVQRLTRGKMAKFNFGVTLHRVVRLDLADQAFESGGTAIQEHWNYVIDELLAQLREQPSILRITYLVENESEALARQRLRVVHDAIAAHWRELNCCYDLKIESELFWRTGGPDS